MMATVDSKPNLREMSRQATRARLLDAAVASLIESGVARTTTLEVQRRAGVSRGALLHHFPNHAQMLCETVEELVRRNEAAVRETRARLGQQVDPVARAVLTLAAIVSQPSYMAELELWAVARTDTELRAALGVAERRARKDGERVVSEVFAQVRDKPGYAPVVAMTLEFLRGLAISGVLRRSPARRQQLIGQWIWAARLLLEQDFQAEV